jgi:hypothetical protein
MTDRDIYLVLGFLIGLLVGIFVYPRVAEADHNTYLPGVPNTPLMQQITRTQSYTYCMDSRSSSYPQFASQLRDVVARYTERTGIRATEVAFGPGCMVQHVMPNGISCVGWAAQIFYANNPVTIQYCWTLGYTDWRSAQGHELGHGVLGLHEQYRDSGGGIGCTGRQWTVMDCGTNPPVRYPQPRDVTEGCKLYSTTIWCGTDGTTVQPPVQCVNIGTAAGVYDPCGDVFRFSNGWSVRPSTGMWFNPHGWPEWERCNQDGIRWNFHTRSFHTPGSSFFDPNRGNFWSYAGPCD